MPEARHRTQEAFANEAIDTVVATVAFGMGIDRSNVRFVHPRRACRKIVEAYQQETGRAGRDGLAAECVLLYSSADVFSWESLVRKTIEQSELDPVEAEASRPLEHLHAMRKYARAARCRHRGLSEYFRAKPIATPPAERAMCASGRPRTCPTPRSLPRRSFPACIEWSSGLGCGMSAKCCGVRSLTG